VNVEVTPWYSNPAPSKFPTTFAASAGAIARKWSDCFHFAASAAWHSSQTLAPT
jgi:hypothetical protein